jgi:hypothetical protein
MKGSVGKGSYHFIDLVIETERSYELQLPGDGQRDENRLRSCGQEANHDHRAPAGGTADRGSEPVVVARGFDDDVRFHRINGIDISSRNNFIRSQSSGDFQRFGVHVDGDNPARAGAFKDSHDQGADGSATDDQRRLTFNISCARNGMPRYAGWLDQGSSSKIHVVWQEAQHAGWQFHIAAEGAILMGKPCGTP